MRQTNVGRRRFLVSLGVTGVLLGGLGVNPATAKSNSSPRKRNFRTHLRGDEEVPPVETKAQGQLLVKFDDDLTQFSYTLIVANIDDVFAAHIHCGPAGQNGPVGVTLFGGEQTSASGILAKETVTEPNPGNVCGWESIEDVYDAIQSGNAYVNVHTVGTPSGEIRGQLG
ncbi:MULTISPECIES: CHRD domain-containing protein [Haloferax]|uniref:CHRD domain-containing protein n=2 Tax=Haloferax TaxID=2251 RepID=A0A6G1Z0Q8_9EURY|nr:MULTISPECIES: CHRD domain-containing protein [Haloferax]KAB1187571.1 CHRD domain-containing protein [Haloferax sp. CBA1149]MRW80227.1 CHRD domain-containing protein [Haloferax marinisediminis]